MATFHFGLTLVTFTNALPPDYFNILEVENISLCSHKCMYHRACKGVVYNSNARLCYLYNEEFPSSNPGLTNVDYAIYNANRDDEVCHPLAVTECPIDDGFIYILPPVCVCYKLHKNTVFKPEADGVCKQEGAKSLLQLDTSDKVEHFMKIIQLYQYAHVSGYRTVDDRWLFPESDNPNAPPYLIWAPGQPNIFAQKCLAVDAEGIHDSDCDSYKPFICGM